MPVTPRAPLTVPPGMGYTAAGVGGFVLYGTNGAPAGEASRQTMLRAADTAVAAVDALLSASPDAPPNLLPTIRAGQALANAICGCVPVPLPVRPPSGPLETALVLVRAGVRLATSAATTAHARRAHASARQVQVDGARRAQDALYQASAIASVLHDMAWTTRSGQ